MIRGGSEPVPAGVEHRPPASETARLRGRNRKDDGLPVSPAGAEAPAQIRIEDAAERLVPPALLGSLGLPLPAFRILEAMQTYGWYVNDAGDSGIDVYSNITLDDFGSDADQAASVFATIGTVIGAHTMYIVPPSVRTR